MFGLGIAQNNQTFLQKVVRKVLYKLVLVTDPPDHSKEDLQSFKVRNYSKTNKIKFVPMITIMKN